MCNNTNTDNNGCCEGGEGHRPTRTHGLVREGSGPGSILWTTVGHRPGSWSSHSTVGLSAGCFPPGAPCTG